MTTFNDALAANVRAARSRLGIQQEDVAQRMRALGFTAWVRQTVGQAEHGRRRITAEEVIGLSMALMTPAPKLLAPLDAIKIELCGKVAFEPDQIVRAATGSDYIAAVGPVPPVDWRENKPVPGRTRA